MEVGYGVEYRNKVENGRIRERLTLGPLTHLSLSLRLRSLSLRALSLRESLGQLMHKGFEQSLNSKGLYFHCILCKESTSIYRERGKGKGERSPWRTKGQEGKGHLGMWRRLLELSRHLS